jgi:hypothetical protein
MNTSERPGEIFSSDIRCPLVRDTAMIQSSFLLEVVMEGGAGLKTFLSFCWK